MVYNRSVGSLLCIKIILKYYQPNISDCKFHNQWYKQEKNQNRINQKLNQKRKQMSSDSDFEQFTQIDSGSSDCQPIQGGSIKKGSYCMLKGSPCKVIQTAVSKPGKHGSAKIHVSGIELFTNKKIDDIFSTAGTAWMPIVTKVEYEVADVNEDGFVSLILKDNSLKEDIKLPADAELSDMLQRCWRQNNENSQVYFTILSACGQSKFVSCRTKETESQ